MNNIIEGMTVLEQTMIKEVSDVVLIMMLFMMLSGVFIAIVSLFVPTAIGLRKENKKMRIMGNFGYILGIILMIASMIPFPWALVETGRYKYKCTLEDNVSANYIEEHFDVIDVRDGIWTISDKDTD